MSLTMILCLSGLGVIIIVAIVSYILQIGPWTRLDFYGVCAWILLAMFIWPVVILILSIVSPRFGLVNVRFAKGNIDRWEKRIEQAQDEEERIMYRKKIKKQAEIVDYYVKFFFKEDEEKE